MIVGFDSTDINQWKQELNQYEERRRTPFPSITSPKRQFMPHAIKSLSTNNQETLKKYQSVQLPSRIKDEVKEVDHSLKKYMYKQFNYEKPYDIITLQSLNEEQSQSSLPQTKQNHAPIRNIYNPINGQPISQEHLKNRRIILPPNYTKRQFDRSRDFNIVNLQYHRDNTARQRAEESQLQSQTSTKVAANHVYDKIYNRFYKPQEEERYWTNKKEENIKKAQENFDLKLPPTYQTRERYIQDYSKPLPESAKRMNERQENYNRSHQAKFIFEQKYKIKNVEDADRRQSRILKRFTRNYTLNKTHLPPKIKSFAFE